MHLIPRSSIAQLFNNPFRLTDNLMAAAAAPCHQIFTTPICEQPMRDLLRRKRMWQMASEKRRIATFCFISSIFWFPVLGLVGCSLQREEPKTLGDRPLAAFRSNLLGIAFETATAIPVHPHIKDRSRAQEKVINACLTLDQPQRALGYIEKIGNWRKGLGYASYAFYAVQHGVTNKVQTCLGYADEISLLPEQEWRRDRIKVRISQTLLLMGDVERSMEFARDIEQSESGKVTQVSAQICEPSAFSNQLQQVDELVAVQNFDLTKNSLAACVNLFDRFYCDRALRDQAEEKIKESWERLPYTIRVEHLLHLTRIAIKHSDFETGLRLAGEAREIVDGTTWPAEYEIPLRAEIAGVFAQCGKTETANVGLNRATALFEEKRTDIVDIYRSETLIPLAEAFLAAGQPERSAEVYRMALEEAVVNPNSRPRAEDLSAICLSMALHEFEPDEALWKRIHDIQSNLGDPW
jgi:tetratricopeptide (TPR) repeat protein